MNQYIFNRQLPLWSFEFRSSSKVEVISRKDIETLIIAKALKDEEFRKVLCNDAKTAISQLFEIELPQTMSIHVVEETGKVAYLILPQNPYEGVTESELTATLGMNLEEIAAWVLEQQKVLLFEDKQVNIQLIARAWRDPSFKKLLFADPILLIQQELGVKLQEDISIEVLEETANNIFIVLPYLADSLLYEQELDTQFINMPMVIGSHANTDRPSCNDRLDTHQQGCQVTQRDTDICREFPARTQFPGYHGCPFNR